MFVGHIGHRLPFGLRVEPMCVRRDRKNAAAYRVHCGARRGSPLQLQENASRALGQGVKEAVLGHARATRILDGLWIPREQA